MNFNEIYDYNMFIKELIKYANQESTSNQKIFKALHDVINAMESMNELNSQEVNMCLQILSTSLVTSIIRK